MRGRLREGWPVVALVVGSIILGATPQSGAAQLRGPEVRSVAFEGNSTFPADSLARAIATRETECRTAVYVPFCALGLDFALNRSHLRDRDLPRDRARLILWYQARGFWNVQVDTPTVERNLNVAEVTFRIEEGQPFLASAIDFVGHEPFEEIGLVDDLPIQEGDLLSRLALDAARDSISSRLKNNGYAYADVFRSVVRPSDDSFNAVVTFEIVPGPLTRYGAINIEGNESLGIGTVLRTAQLQRGEPFRSSEIDDARGRLYGLDIVRNASVVPDTSVLAQDTVVDVAIVVAEGDAYRMRAGGGWSTAECLNVESRWTARNFLGGGRSLQVRARVGNLLAAQFRDVLCTESGEDTFARLTGIASVDFIQPWIFSTRNALSASVYLERQSLPDVFIRRAIGAQVGLSRRVSAETQLTGFYRPEISELDADDVLFCTGFLVCSPEDIARLEGANSLSPVGLTVARDRSDDLLSPRSGSRVLLDIEHAGPWTGSDFRYDRVVAEGSSYTPAGRVVIATRLRGGWVGAGGFDGLVGSGAQSSEIVHPQKRFYSGGANSVRGFAQSRLGPRVLFATPGGLLDPGGGACTIAQLNALTCTPASDAPMNPRPTGGTRLIEANLELRVPLNRILEVVFFGDAGQAWGANESIELASMQVTPGLGFRVASPVGPIRFDLAYSFRGDEALPVVTERLRPYNPATDRLSDRIFYSSEPSDVVLDWVSTGELIFLDAPFLFGANQGGLQLHVSIGQAF
ncbi:MAG: BamA/TamA family outer membrane protein [Gemmatimonadota bacterium]